MREDIKINDRALALEKQLIEKLELVFDTDVELDVYNLGLIYELDLDLSLIHISALFKRPIWWNTASWCLTESVGV